MTNVEVRLGTPGNFKTLARIKMPALPEKGELFNLDGEPYFVIRRDWASDNTPTGCFWCYIYLQKVHG